MIQETDDGVVADVRVVPRARETALAGIRNDEIIVRVAAPPEAGAANQALIGFLADRLHVARRAVRITRGEHSRRKRIAITGVSAAALRTLAGR
jgi:uncharacterized protein (TIGR00251 family)